MMLGSVTLLLERLGARTRHLAGSFVYAVGFGIEVARQLVLFLFGKRPAFRVLTLQILFTGVEALAIVAVLSLSLGAVIIIQGLSLLPQFGQAELTYTVLVVVITRELGPILTAFIVAARSGTAVATELGTMVVNREIEAYIATGVNPIAYLVVPRVIGVTVSVILLNVYFNVFGLAGAFFASRPTAGVALWEYVAQLGAVLQVRDLLGSALRSAVFGVIIALVSCHHGLLVEQASTEIPQQAIRAVSRCFVLLIVVNAGLTLVYYL